MIGEEAKTYKAGSGFVVTNAQGTEFDIAITQSEEDIELNGILDVDKVRVVLKYGQPISELLTDKEKLTAAIRDPEGALPAFFGEATPRIVNWAEVERDPANIASRIIRGLAKYNALPIDLITTQKIQRLIRADRVSNTLQMSRNLLKIFDDSHWVIEFQALIDIGFFTHHFKSFSQALMNQQFVNAQGIEERIFQLLASSDQSDSHHFVKLLKEQRPELAQKISQRLVQENRLRSANSALCHQVFFETK